MSSKRLFSYVFVFILCTCSMHVHSANANTVAASIKAFLQINNISTSNVHFDNDKQQIVIENILKANFPIQGGELNIDKLIINKPNLKALDAAASAQELVAEEIQFQNARIGFKELKNTFALSIASFSITKWSQNLGKLIQANATGDAYDFIKELLNMHIQNVALRDLRMELNEENTASTLKASMQNFVLNNINTKLIESCVMEGIDIFVNEANEESISIRSDSLSWSPIALPSQSTFNLVWAVASGDFKKWHESAQAISFIKYINDFMRLSTDTKVEFHNVSTKYTHGSDTSLTVQAKHIVSANVFYAQPILKFDSFAENIHVYGEYVQIPIDFKIEKIHSFNEADLINYSYLSAKNSLQNFSMASTSQYSTASNKKFMHDLFGTQLQANADMDFKFFAEKESLVELSIDSSSIGKMMFTLHAKLPDSLIKSILSFYNLQLFVDVINLAEWFDAPMPFEASLSFEDKGIFARWLEHLHSTKTPHLSLEAFSGKILPGLISEVQGALAILGSQNMPTLELWVNNPGMLRIEAINRTPISPAEAILNPELLLKDVGFITVCRQGTPLLEQLRELKNKKPTPSN